MEVDANGRQDKPRPLASEFARRGAEFTGDGKRFAMWHLRL
jgi:hypothetical protein